MRAFTLLCSYYDQARRAVTYLRWGKGDLDSIAPSLYKRRNKRLHRSTRKNDQPAPETTRPADQQKPAPEARKPADPPAIGANGPFMPSAPGNGEDAPVAQPRLAGMPGGSPFAQ